MADNIISTYPVDFERTATAVGYGNDSCIAAQGNRMSFTARGFEAGSGCSSLPFSAFLRGSSRFLLC